MRLVWQFLAVAAVALIGSRCVTAVEDEALRAGASGFLLKDAPPAQLLHGIRTVATGAALLDPEVTRRLVGRYAARIRPDEDSSRDLPLTPASWRFSASSRTAAPTARSPRSS